MENLKETDVVVIYRDNDLFQKYVPLIEEILASKNYVVEKKIFQTGTSEGDIKEWTDHNGKDYFNQVKTCLTDITCYNAVGKYFYEKASSEKDEWKKGNIKSLDSLLSEVYKKIIYNGEGIGDEDKLKQTKMLYLKTLEMTKKPEKAVIVAARLPHHEPFYEMSDGKNVSNVTEDARKFADILKGWFKEGGIPEVKTVDYVDELSENDKDDEGIWMVLDRHTRNEPIIKGRYIHAPFSDFFNDVFRLNLLNTSINAGEISLSLKETVEEQISTFKYYGYL